LRAALPFRLEILSGDDHVAGVDGVGGLRGLHMALLFRADAGRPLWAILTPARNIAASLARAGEAGGAAVKGAAGTLLTIGALWILVVGPAALRTAIAVGHLTH
jgi:hypothetical protein